MSKILFLLKQIKDGNHIYLAVLKFAIFFIELMCGILAEVLIIFYNFLSFCFGMDASVKCYIHTRTFLHKSNQKILNQKIHYNFQKK